MKKISISLLVICFSLALTQAQENPHDVNSEGSGIGSKTEGGGTIVEGNGGDWVGGLDTKSGGLFICNGCRIDYGDDGNRRISGGEIRGDIPNKRNVQYKGTIVGDNGFIYSGQIMNDRPHGTGTQRYSDGAVYEGNFVGGVRSGNGKVKFPLDDGTTATYDGEWDDDKWDGTGTYSNATVTISGDVFKNGRITGDNAKVQENGKKSYYLGGLKNGKLDGIGTVYNAAGNVSGQYKYEDGEMKAIVLSEGSKKAISDIKDVVKNMSMAQDILTAFSLYTAFSTVDENPIVFIFNVYSVLDGSSDGKDFFTMIAKGIRDLDKIQYLKIKKIADMQHFKASKTNNLAEKNFWKTFKTTIKTKSSPGIPGFNTD